MPINRATCVAAVFLSTTLSAAAADFKAPIRGLVSMGPMKFSAENSEPANTLEPLNARPGIFGGIVVLATWRQLQPSANAGIAEGNTIDHALEEVRAYNRRNPGRPLGVKLRVWN